jgi:hypothetical protein
MATVRVVRLRVIDCGSVDRNDGALRWWVSGHGEKLLALVEEGGDDGREWRRMAESGNGRDIVGAIALVVLNK